MALHALSLPTPVSLIFSSRLSRSGSSVSKRDFTALIRVFQSVAQWRWSHVASLGLLFYVLSHRGSKKGYPSTAQGRQEESWSFLRLTYMHTRVGICEHSRI